MVDQSSDEVTVNQATMGKNRGVSPGWSKREGCRSCDPRVCPSGEAAITGGGAGMVVVANEAAKAKVEAAAVGSSCRWRDGESTTVEAGVGVGVRTKVGAGVGGRGERARA